MSNEKSAIDKLVTNSGSKKSDLLSSLEMLVNESFLEGKTIFNNVQVTAITMMNWGGQVYRIPFLTKFVNSWVRYRISGDNGRGRDDIIKIAQAIQQQQDKEHERFKELLETRM
jgi:hypothetical protein